MIAPFFWATPEPVTPRVGNSKEGRVSTCLKCGVELSDTLDAYYGKDIFEAACCVKCRRKT